MPKTGYFKKKQYYPIASRNHSLVINSLMYTGIIFILISLIYMICNIEKADTIISLWLPFIISGVVLVLMSAAFSGQNSGTKK